MSEPTQSMADETQVREAETKTATVANDKPIDGLGVIGSVFLVVISLILGVLSGLAIGTHQLDAASARWSYHTTATITPRVIPGLSCVQEGRQRYCYKQVELAFTDHNGQPQRIIHTANDNVSAGTQWELWQTASGDTYVAYDNSNGDKAPWGNRNGWIFFGFWGLGLLYSAILVSLFLIATRKLRRRIMAELAQASSVTA